MQRNKKKTADLRQKDLKRLRERSDRGLLEFNPSKCKAMRVVKKIGRLEELYRLRKGFRSSQVKDKDVDMKIKT